MMRNLKAQSRRGTYRNLRFRPTRTSSFVFFYRLGSGEASVSAPVLRLYESGNQR